MSWVAVAIAGSAIIGGVASNSASKKQANAANNAGNLQQQMFNITNNQQGPYRESGYGALNKLQTYMGSMQAPTAVNKDDYWSNSSAAKKMNWLDPLGQKTGIDFIDPLGQAGGVNVGSKALGFGKKDKNNSDPTFNQKGYDAAVQKYNTDLENYNQAKADPNWGLFNHQFNKDDLNANLAPNWQWALQQGQGAVQNMANAGGGALSGNALRGISDYTINKSGDLYQQAFSNYTANQSNIFNRLSSIAGLGQTANQATGTAAIQSGANIGNSMMAAGQAQASGQVGMANAFSNGVNNAGSWYGMNNMINSNKAATSQW